MQGNKTNWWILRKKYSVKPKAQVNKQKFLITFCYLDYVMNRSSLTKTSNISAQNSLKSGPPIMNGSFFKTIFDHIHKKVKPITLFLKYADNRGTIVNVSSNKRDSRYRFISNFLYPSFSSHIIAIFYLVHLNQLFIGLIIWFSEIQLRDAAFRETMIDRTQVKRRYTVWCRGLNSPQKAVNKTIGVKKMIMTLNIFRKEVACKTLTI